MFDVLGFGYAAYHFLYEEKVFAKSDVPPPPREQVEAMKTQIEQALQGDGCFAGISSINWRPNAGNYRIDVQMLDGCGKGDAQRIVARVVDLVRRSTDGVECEVWTYALGREIYHRLP